MMRLPRFRYVGATSIAEAARVLADHAPGHAMLLAGGTDLLPNMKRRQQTPEIVVGLRGIEAVAGLEHRRETAIGAGVSLAAIARDERIRREFTGLWQAASLVATPHIRNMATVGGNLCLDTRCNYYDQNHEWRRAIGFCMKKDGDTCWVAPGSDRCLAVSSTDTAPALIALGARVELVSSRDGARAVDLSDLYRNDGIRYMTRRPDEVLTRVILDGVERRSVYWKLRRRGSFDFPVLSVAAAARFGPGRIVEEARIVLGAVASRPIVAEDASASLVGGVLDDDAVGRAAGLAYREAKPMDNTDFGLHWRKRVTREFVSYALRELRGDDMRAVRARIGRQDLVAVVA